MGCDRQRLVYALYEAGDVFRRWVDCGRWACAACGKKKLAGLAERLITVAPASVGYGEFGPKLSAHGGAVRRALARRGGASLRLSREDGGLVVVTDMAITGRGWKVTKKTLKDAVVELVGLDLSNPPRRTDWVGWKAEEEEKERRPMLFRATFTSVLDCNETLELAEIQLLNGVVPDPEAAAERLRNVAGTGSETWERRSFKGDVSPGQG